MYKKDEHEKIIRYLPPSRRSRPMLSCFNQRFEIRRDIGFKIHFFMRVRMSDGQRHRVQRQSLSAFRTTIYLVSYHRMSILSKVHTDLVLPPCIKTDLQQTMVL